MLLGFGSFSALTQGGTPLFCHTSNISKITPPLKNTVTHNRFYA